MLWTIIIILYSFVGVGFWVWRRRAGKFSSPAADRCGRGIDLTTGPWTKSVTVPKGNKKEEVG